MSNLVPQNYTPKTFWQKPEGKPGVLLAVALIGLALFYGWGVVVPFVLATISSTFWLGLYAVGLFALVDVTFGITGIGKTFRNLFKNVFQSIARGIAMIYTTIDPIGILKNDLDDMEKEKQQLDQAVQRFSGSNEMLTRDIDKQKVEITQLGRQAEKAKSMGNQSRDALERERLLLQSQTFYEQAGMAMTGVKNTEVLQKETERLLTTFQKWSQIADAKIDRTKYKVNYLEKQRKMIIDAKRTLNFGQRLLRGNPEQLKQVDMAIEYLAEDTARTLGEIREFSRFTDKLYTTDTIERGAAADEAASQLAKFNQKMLTSANELRLDSIQIPGAVAQPVLRGTSSSSDFDDMFNK